MILYGVRFLRLNEKRINRVDRFVPRFNKLLSEKKVFVDWPQGQRNNRERKEMENEIYYKRGRMFFWWCGMSQAAPGSNIYRTNETSAPRFVLLRIRDRNALKLYRAERGISVGSELGSCEPIRLFKSVSKVKFFAKSCVERFAFTLLRITDGGTRDRQVKPGTSVASRVEYVSKSQLVLLITSKLLYISLSILWYLPISTLHPL